MKIQIGTLGSIASGLSEVNREVHPLTVVRFTIDGHVYDIQQAKGVPGRIQVRALGIDNDGRAIVVYPLVSNTINIGDEQQ